MKCRMVSHPGWWPEGTLREDGLTFAASTPALVTLLDDQLPHSTTGSFLSTADYREIWEQTFLDVWRLVERSMEEETPDRPNLLMLHGYSIFLLLCECRVLWTVLDRASARTRLTELVVEPIDAQEPGIYLYYSELYSRYFHEVGALWARARGVPITVVSGAPPRSTQRVRRRRGPLEVKYLLRRRLGERAREIWRRAMSGSKTPALPSRQRIFYVPQAACGLDHDAPAGALDATPWLQKFSASPLRADECAPVPRLDGLLRRSGDPPSDWFQERFDRHVRRTLPSGQAVFDGFRGVVADLVVQGKQPAAVLSAPFIDFGGWSGYMAEAFRLSGAPVAGVQHGGNCRLVRRGAAPTLLTDYLGGLFFQWGPGATDESATYRVQHAFTVVTTGSVRMARLMAASATSSGRRRRAGRTLRVLYALPVLDVVTTIGNNVPWDSYLSVVRGVCERLSASRHECLVKVHHFDEAPFLGLRGIQGIRIVEWGRFVDFMRDADLLILDSLASSPIYEALATDLSIVLYTADEHQEWDPEFIGMLRRRALCYSDRQSYLDGLETVLRDPEGAFSAAGVVPGDELRRAYFPPASLESFWATVSRTLNDCDRGQLRH